MQMNKNAFIVIRSVKMMQLMLAQMPWWCAELGVPISKESVCMVPGLYRMPHSSFAFPTDYKRPSPHTDWRWKEEKGLGFRSIDYQLINGWHFSPTLRWEWLCHFWLNSLRMSATLKNNFRQITFPDGAGGRQGKAIADMTWGEIPVERAPHKRKYDSKSKQHALCNKSSARGFILLCSKNALCQLKEEHPPSLFI